MRGKLKLYTTLPERGVVAAADLAHGGGRPHRSHSVPPPGSRYSPIQDHRAPSSLDTNYRTYDRHQARQHTASFETPPDRRYERSGSFGRGVHSPDSHGSSGSRAPAPAVFRPGMGAGGAYPPGYSYSYSGYNNAVTPYTNSLAYGMPPSNPFLNHFLTGGQFPMHAHYARTRMLMGDGIISGMMGRMMSLHY